MFSFEAYKNKLTEVEQKFSPDTLFYQGNISLLQKMRRVSVVGFRDVSDEGRRLFIMENVLQSSVSWAKEMMKYGAEILTRDNYKYLIDNMEYLTLKNEYEYAF